MKLLLDTRWLTNNPSGVGMYIKNLILGLCKHSEIFTTLFGNRDKKILPKHMQHIPFLGIKKKVFQFLWKTFHSPSIEFVTGDFPLVHYTNGTAIPQRHGKYILTVHDLAYITFPETIEKKNLKFLQKNVPVSIKNASHIIAVSDYTKDKIIKHFHISPTKITRIYNGIDDVFFHTYTNEKRKEIRMKYGLKKKYFLSVSTLEPRKDFLTQIRAYRGLAESIRKEYDLVIAGGKGWNYQDIFDEAHKYLNTGHIKLLGYISQEDIPLLMQEASLYLHTSLEEGFGLSLVQALASRCPVIASKTSCHPEILKEYGTYFEVGNVNDLQEKIQKNVSKTPDTNILEAGYLYAKHFRWNKMQEETISLYKKTKNS